LPGQWLSERLRQQFSIENRPGAGSNIATEAVARAAADGYTLLLIGGANTINATLFDKLNFDFLRLLDPITRARARGSLTASLAGALILWMGH
jgi:tripartite-type tricarboxylate transporter receptor subunit TctC